jgi:hypothetical protein
MTSFYIESDGCTLTFPTYGKWRLTLEYLIAKGHKINAVGWI